MCDLSSNYKIKNFDDIVGQEKIKELFKKFIQKNNIPHSVFYGPCGTGKSSFAKIVAKTLDSDFFEIDGGNFKTEELRKIIKNSGIFKPLVFIDEVHRLNKAQQELLLLPLQNNEIIFFCASTMNPFYSLSKAIRSRCLLFEFKALNEMELGNILNKINIKISKEAKDYLILTSNGDARAMLNLLEYALISGSIEIDNLKLLRNQAITEGTSEKEVHYDLISAFIKSMRGSDIDASIYYLARLLNAGEDAEFIARRMVIFASEDIGNANPNALNLATSCMLATKNIGMPEARIILSQCAIYLASCPKSNSSYKAINKAIEITNNPQPKIPEFLTKKGEDKYNYPHDFGGYIKTKYLPSGIEEFHQNKQIGFEKTLFEWLEKIKK